MMRSMFSAVSGLSAHQAKMDVIGNNIANVNTAGFKAGRVTFQEVYAQTIKGASGAQGGRGGTNPQQVGLGMSVASIDTIFTRGASESTGIGTDLMINGENGFFMVSDDTNFLNRFYTRSGNFGLDDNGNLVTADGFKVLGYMADETGRLKTSMEGIKIDKSLIYPPQATKPSDPPIPGEEIVTLAKNLNSNTGEIEKILSDLGAAAYDPSASVVGIEGQTEPAIYSFDAVASAAKGKPVYAQKNEEMSKALGQELSIDVFDDFGNKHILKLLFTKKEVNSPAVGETTWVVDAFYMNEDGAMIRNDTTNAYDATTGEPNPTSGAADGFHYYDNTGATAGPFELVFGANGKLKSGTDAKMKFSIGTDLTKGAAALDFEMDLSKLTQYANDSDVAVTFRKGYKQGALDSYAISKNGEIVGIFNNGQRRVLGRVALANFKNPGGLQKSQSNMFIETRNSGIPTIGLPSTSGFADLIPGSLEMSNVDLSREFTTMITTQRGFQANSRIISTTDQMLEELVNLKR